MIEDKLGDKDAALIFTEDGQLQIALPKYIDDVDAPCPEHVLTVMALAKLCQEGNEELVNLIRTTINGFYEEVDKQEIKETIN